MNFKTTIILFIVLAAVVGGLWSAGLFSQKQEKQLGKEPPAVVRADQILLIAPPLKDVNKIRLELAGRGHMQFTRAGQAWKISDPVNAPALPWELTDLTAVFENARKLETLRPDASLSLADMGLEPPTAKITFEEKGRTLTFLIGKNVVASENTYIKTPDSPDVYVIDQNLKEKIKKNLSDYRDKQLWEINKKNVTEFTFTGKDGRVYRVVKNDKGEWSLSSPIQAPADKKVVASAVEALASLKAEDFTEDHPTDLAMFGLAKPVWNLTVVESQTIKPTTQTSQPATKRIEHHLLIGQPAGLNSDQVYAKLADKNWVVAIAQDKLKTVLPDIVAWREKSLVPINKNAVTRIDIRRSAQDVTLFKENNVWKLQGDGEVVSADEKIVTTLLNALSGMQAASFIDQPDKSLLKKSKLDQPVCTITLYAGEKAEPLVLTFGDVTPSGMFRYVKRSGLDYISAVPTEKLLPLFTPAINYRDKQMMAFSMDDVKSIRLKQHNRIYTLSRVSPSLPWQITSPVAAEADQGSVKNILMTLATLKAQDFVAKGYLANYNLEHPDIEATLDIEMEVPVVKMDQTASQPATAGKPASRLLKQQFILALSKQGDKYYAVRPGPKNPLIATVLPQVYADLNAEMIDRSAFGDKPLPTGDITQLTINASKAAPIVFEKVKGQWTFPADPVVKIDQQKFDQLLQTLSNLKVLRFAAFEPAQTSYGLETPSLALTAGNGKDTWTLTVGKNVPGRETRYGRTSLRPWIFELSNIAVEKLNVSLKDLVKTPSAEVPPAANSPAY